VRRIRPGLSCRADLVRGGPWERVFLGLLLAAAVYCMMGCGRQERAQAASDLDAGIQAAAQAIADHATEEAIAILTSARKYAPAAAGVHPSEFPTPQMAPAEIRKDPAKYDKEAPPVPKTWSAALWAGLGTAGLIGLWIAKQAAPLIPGGGPLVKLAADALWTVAATKDQKAADSAKEAVATAAGVVAPVLAALKGAQGLPEDILKKLEDPAIQKAIDALQAKS
jgi:hypothetical protein